VTSSASDLVFSGLSGVSERDHGSDEVQGRNLQDPQTCRGGPVRQH
jgi:hypothetical protein